MFEKFDKEKSAVRQLVRKNKRLFENEEKHQIATENDTNYKKRQIFTFLCNVFQHFTRFRESERYERSTTIELVVL